MLKRCGQMAKKNASSRKTTYVLYCCIGSQILKIKLQFENVTGQLPKNITGDYPILSDPIQHADSTSTPRPFFSFPHLQNNKPRARWKRLTCELWICRPGNRHRPALARTSAGKQTATPGNPRIPRGTQPTATTVVCRSFRKNNKTQTIRAEHRTRGYDTGYGIYRDHLHYRVERGPQPGEKTNTTNKCRLPLLYPPFFFAV